MITCDYSEFKTIAKKILTKDKTEPQKIYSVIVEVQLMNPSNAWVTTTWRLGLWAPFVTYKREYQNNLLNEFPLFLPVVAS